MRSDEQIASIRSRITGPRLVEGFLSPEEIGDLIGIFRSHADLLVRKNTGPVTLGIRPLLGEPIFRRVLAMMEEHIGPFDLNAGLFFETSSPHVIHNDDVYSLPDTYKAFTIPLEISGFSGIYPRLCFFEQFYFHGPAKFFNGSSGIPAHFNASVYEYSRVDGLNQKGISREVRDLYLTHLRPEWLEGLSIDSILEWRPGTAIIFDSLRLHCASDFRRVGITSKLGLSIFTRKS